MCPAFGESIADKDLAEFRFRSICVQELHEMAGIDFMHRGEEQVSFARDILFLFLPIPCRIWRRNVVNRRQTSFVGTRNIDVSEVPRLVWRSLSDLCFLSAGHRNKIVVLDEFSKISQLRGRGGHHTCSFGFVSRSLIAAVLKRFAGSVFSTQSLHRIEIEL